METPPKLPKINSLPQKKLRELELFIERHGLGLQLGKYKTTRFVYNIYKKEELKRKKKEKYSRKLLKDAEKLILSMELHVRSGGKKKVNEGGESRPKTRKRTLREDNEIVREKEQAIKQKLKRVFKANRKKAHALTRRLVRRGDGMELAERISEIVEGVSRRKESVKKYVQEEVPTLIDTLELADKTMALAEGYRKRARLHKAEVAFVEAAFLYDKAREIETAKIAAEKSWSRHSVTVKVGNEEMEVYSSLKSRTWKELKKLAKKMDNLEAVDAGEATFSIYMGNRFGGTDKWTIIYAGIIPTEKGEPTLHKFILGGNSRGVPEGLLRTASAGDGMPLQAFVTSIVQLSKEVDEGYWEGKPKLEVIEGELPEEIKASVVVLLGKKVILEALKVENLYAALGGLKKQLMRTYGAESLDFAVEDADLEELEAEMERDEFNQLKALVLAVGSVEEVKEMFGDEYDVLRREEPVVEEEEAEEEERGDLYGRVAIPEMNLGKLERILNQLGFTKIPKGRSKEQGWRRDTGAHFSTELPHGTQGGVYRKDQIRNTVSRLNTRLGISRDEFVEAALDAGVIKSKTAVKARAMAMA